MNKLKYQSWTLKESDVELIVGEYDRNAKIWPFTVVSKNSAVTVVRLIVTTRADLILKEGFEALRNKLGEVNMERFIVLINREKFNYTEWRKNLFEDLELEELAEKANQYSNSL